MIVACPHCQAKTVLKVEGAPAPIAAPSVPPPKTSTTPIPPTRPPTPTTPPPNRPIPPPPTPAAAIPSKPPPPRPAPAVPIPAKAEAPLLQEAKSKTGLLVVIVLGVLALGAVGYAGYTKYMSGKTETVTAPIAPRTPKPKKKTTGTPTNAERPVTTEATPKPGTAKGPKSPGDLKSGDVILEKSKGGSSLVYAVGTVANNSDHQRFGVKVEVDILEQSGKKVGKATDYIQVIEPRGTWRFHALVLEDKAAAAKIASIKEDE